MKTKSIFLSLIFAMLAGITFVSCDDDDTDDLKDPENNFKSLESPYLICANRNPGGVGFDFNYKKKKGGANNLDSPSVDDFAFDLKIRTIKGEKPDGNPGGAPYFKLFDNTVKAVNYSSVDATCKGITAFNNLNSSNIKSYTLKTDDTSFDISSLTSGETGKPLMSELQKEYKKLVIGMKWKSAAYNDIAEDEPIWIIKTPEGHLIKLIVTDFPASPAPTPTGYISVKWDFLD